MVTAAKDVFDFIKEVPGFEKDENLWFQVSTNFECFSDSIDCYLLHPGLPRICSLFRGLAGSTLEPDEDP